MIELHLRGRVLPGRRSDLVTFLCEAIPFYENPGGIGVRVLWDMADPDQFIEVIEYIDHDTYERDQARVDHDAEMREYLRRWRALLTEPPHLSTYRVDTPHG